MRSWSSLPQPAGGTRHHVAARPLGRLRRGRRHVLGPSAALLPPPRPRRPRRRSPGLQATRGGRPERRSRPVWKRRGLRWLRPARCCCGLERRRGQPRSDRRSPQALAGTSWLRRSPWLPTPRRRSPIRSAARRPTQPPAPVRVALPGRPAGRGVSSPSTTTPASSPPPARRRRPPSPRSAQSCREPPSARGLDPLHSRSGVVQTAWQASSRTPSSRSGVYHA